MAGLNFVARNIPITFNFSFPFAVRLRARVEHAERELGGRER